ncbi:uncharacterized protein LTHEOB_6788 [Lasiodiplodia theobromae]|uniref:uncharacterized protein n=1 Tax=Lasiodiplodia theobromae TaxID=45133 RepID=UPI0015C3D991|nr:uncharacterized protein LTHEOB_6788 [Lasiodiplodia theobromae]KAF4543054.1 hypothetical protein LTHEOB_6788 [Lasiodiplodia theobromae]
MTMDRSFDFEIYRLDNKIRLARVLGHIDRLADLLRGKGGCSAFQISVELGRCLVAAFAFSLNDSSPTVDVATSFVIRCHALLLGYETDDKSMPPDKHCWAFFFYLVTKELGAHPNKAVACEHSTLMVAKTIHFGHHVPMAITNKAAFEQLCEDFANAQLEALVQRAHHEPALLSYSIFGSLRSVIFKPTADSAGSVFHVAKFLGQSLREHNVLVCPDNISRTFTKVLASCALWSGSHVGGSFAAEFMQRFLVYSSIDQLQEEGEAIAVERVLDAVLRNADPVGRITRETLEAIVVREPPGPCLTWGAPPYNLTPPSCQLTPAEIICYFPNILCIPEIWRWMTNHGWTPVNIPKLLNRTRALDGIWKLSHSTFRNWQRNANACFRDEKDLMSPPPTSKINISPYVHAYCNAPKRGRHKRTVEMTMSRLVHAVKRHPTGDDAGYFTALAKYAAASGDLGGKILVSQVRHTDDVLVPEEEALRLASGVGSIPENMGGNATHVYGNIQEENGDSSQIDGVYEEA